MTDKEQIERLTGEVRALRLYIDAVNYLMTASSENKDTVLPQSKKAFEENMNRAQDELEDTPIALKAFETTLEEVVEAGTLMLLPLDVQQPN